MKKMLEITDEVEQAISRVCDVALQYGKLAAHDVVTQVKNVWAKIQQVEDKVEDNVEKK